MASHSTDAVYELLQADACVRPDIQHDAKLVLRDLWSLRRVPLRTPCTNPCSLMRSDLTTLVSQPYSVGAKTDGIRFFILFAALVNEGSEEEEDEEYAVLIDRAFNMFAVRMLHVPPAVFQGTLLDGELVRSGQGGLTFVAFDAVASCGFSFKTRRHSERVAELRRLMPHLFLASVTLSVKPWFPLSASAVQQLTSAAPGEDGAPQSDGLILVAELKELVVGMQRDMFKWKPAALHTIDFLRQRDVLYLADGSSHVSAATLNIVCAPSWPVDHADGVMECTCTFEKGRWLATPFKRRIDKTEPNSVHVARLTLQNIEEDITASELVQMLAGKHSPSKMPPPRALA